MGLKCLLFYFYLSSFGKGGEKETEDWSLADVEHAEDQRSHDTTKPATRPSRTVVTNNPVTENAKKYYQSFNDLCKRVKTLKTLNDWIVQELEDRLVLKKKRSQVMLPEIEIMIDDSLGFTIYVYGWLLPEDHELHTTNLRSSTNITVSDLVKSIAT